MLEAKIAITAIIVGLPFLIHMMIRMVKDPFWCRSRHYVVSPAIVGLCVLTIAGCLLSGVWRYL